MICDCPLRMASGAGPPRFWDTVAYSEARRVLSQFGGPIVPSDDARVRDAAAAALMAWMLAVSHTIPTVFAFHFFVFLPHLRTGGHGGSTAGCSPERSLLDRKSSSVRLIASI